MSPRISIARGTIAAVVLSAWSGAARAEEPASAYCAKVHERAGSDAALLLAPTLFVQEIRFPSSGSVDLGPTEGNGFQTRAGLMYSLADLYRGLRTSKVADASCQEQVAAVKLRDFIDYGADEARLAALQAQAAYLRAHREEWRALSDTATQRLAQRIITVVEFNALSTKVDVLEQKLTQAEGEASRIEQGSPPVSGDRPSALEERYFATTMERERQESALRSAEPWRLQVTGAVVAATTQSSLDWYGVAEVGYNLGGLARYGSESRYLAARAEELHTARYELLEQLRRFRAQNAASLAQTKQELALVERDVAVLANVRALLEGSDTGGVGHARDLIAVDLFSAEADRVFLGTLSTRLSAISEERHGQ